MRHIGRRPIGVIIAIGLTLAACGSDGSSSSADTAVPATASSVAATEKPGMPDESAPDTRPATSGPATTGASPTPSSTSVQVADTTAVPTTSAPPSTGWEESDFVVGAAVQGYSGNWWGEAGPSPAAPTGTDPPADGWYVASLREPWDPAHPDTLAVRVQRLERCSVLPGGCENMDDPSEMNFDPTWQLDLDVPLDATTDVVVGGFKCWADVPEQKQGTGIELSSLFSAYTADYAAVVEPHLSDDGTANWELIQEIAAAPSGGFLGEEAMCPGEESLAGPLRYVHDDAPVLLLQTITDSDGGPLGATDLVGLGGVQYTDGVPIFYFYAGFYS